jgi:hypothetical protein
MADELTRTARDELVQRIYDLEARIYSPPGTTPLTPAERAVAREQLYATLGEYADRLPRMRLSVCPFCEAPLKRVFDPFGMDGPWWHADVTVKYEEPASCEHFRVLLGAVHVGDRVPDEVQGEVRPGPEAPFVVPALLSRAGMRAVAGHVALATGDSAFPVAYFSDQPTRAIELHQPWLRTTYWFEHNGRTGWTTKNDVFDFDLRPYVEAGRLLWVDLQLEEDRVFSGEDAEFPFHDLPGVRERQQIVGGQREFLGLPTGEPLNPFDE